MFLQPPIITLFPYTTLFRSVFPARTRKVNANNSAALTGRSTPLIMFSVRSEERFSRNAETDIVCRLLLEKKKILPMSTVSGLMGPYMRPIPIGASLAMIFSLLVSFIVTSWSSIRLLKLEANNYLYYKKYDHNRDLHSFPTRRSSDLYTQGKREQFSGFNRTLDAINNVFRKFSAFHDETGRLNVDGMNIIKIGRASCRERV